MFLKAAKTMNSAAPLTAASFNLAALQTLTKTCVAEPAAGGTFLSQLNGVKPPLKEKEAQQGKNASSGTSANSAGSGLGRQGFAGQNPLDGEGLLNEILSAKAQSCALSPAAQEETLPVAQGSALPGALAALQNVVQASLKLNFDRASLLLALALILRAAALAGSSSPGQGGAEAAFKASLGQLCYEAFPLFCLLCPRSAVKKGLGKRSEDLKKRRKYLLHKFKYGKEPACEEPLPRV